jgi:microcystin degradation protein MlrC
MARRDDDLLDRIGRRSTGLTIDDVGAAVGDVLKRQKRDLIATMRRMIQLERVNNSAKPDRVRNLHARLTAVESEIRSLKKGGSR